MKPGQFIAIEGPDGSGKTTLAAYLHESMQALGFPVIRSRELGGTPVAEVLRGLIIGSAAEAKNEVVDKHTRMLMVIASRLQHWNVKILPALAEGKYVISDRCFDSTHVYQGTKDNLLDLQAYLQSYPGMEVTGRRPDITLFFDVDPEVSWERTKADRRKGETFNENSYEERVQDIWTYRDRMRQANEAKPGCVHMINANLPLAGVKQQIDWFLQRLVLTHGTHQQVLHPSDVEYCPS